MTLRAGVPAPRPIATTLRGAGTTATGHRRDTNEDALLAGPDWFVVADGIGGHAAGDVASRIAVDAFVTNPPAATVDDVRAAIERAHAAIRRHAARHGLIGMGTTLVGATLVERGSAIAVFHVGDSRCYRFADGTLTLVTTDHSHVQELLSAGRVTAAAAATHPLRNVVTRALGVDTGVDPEIARLPASPARLLLCSDGLSDELAPSTIGRVLATAPTPRAAAELLVRLALTGPARDNVTAAVVDVAVDDDRDVDGNRVPGAA